MMLVTLEQAKEHLRIEPSDSSGGADDSDLTLKIKAASRAVIRYIGAEQDFLDSAGDVVEDSNGPTVPEDIQAATLLLLGSLHRNRDGEPSSNQAQTWEHGFLPRPVISLLYPYRLPTLA